MSIGFGDYGEAGRRHCRINFVVLWFSISFVSCRGLWIWVRVSVLSALKGSGLCLS